MKKKVKKTVFECVVIIIVGTTLFFFTHRNDGKEKDGMDGTYIEQTEKSDKASEPESEETEKDTGSSEYEDALESLETGSITEDELEKQQADDMQLEIRDMSETVAGLIVDREAFEYALKQRHMRTIATNTAMPLRIQTTGFKISVFAAFFIPSPIFFFAFFAPSFSAGPLLCNGFCDLVGSAVLPPADPFAFPFNNPFL